jgi:hypothetical protein
LNVFQSTVKNTNLIKEGAMRQRRLAAAVALLLAVSVTGCMEDNMSFLSTKIEIAANPNLAEWIPRIAYNSVEDEFLVVWTEQGVRV